jgi:hypothetical protein
MKIVIQNPKSSLYLATALQWTPNGADALVFENFRIAVEFCATHKLGDVQIVLWSDEDHCDLRIPLAGSLRTLTATPALRAPLLEPSPARLAAAPAS